MRKGLLSTRLHIQIVSSSPIDTNNDTSAAAAVDMEDHTHSNSDSDLKIFGTTWADESLDNIETISSCITATRCENKFEGEKRLQRFPRLQLDGIVLFDISSLMKSLSINCYVLHQLSSRLPKISLSNIGGEVTFLTASQPIVVR